MEKIAGKVQRFYNKLGKQELANVVRAGYRAVFGKEPTAEILGSGWAQVMMENSGNLMNNNLGNITAGSGWKKSGKDYITLPAGQKGQIIEYDASGKPLTNVREMSFRSYNTPEEGAVDYWKLLNNNYYKSVLNWFATGDSVSTALALGDKGYYTANRLKYSGIMATLFDDFMRNIAPKISGLESNPQPAPGPKPEYKAWRNSEVQEMPESLKAKVEKYTVNKPEDKEIEQKQEIVQNRQDLSIKDEISDLTNEFNEEQEMSPIIQEYNILMRQLLARGPIEKIVRKSIEKTVLPNTKSLIALSSTNGSFSSLVRYAQILSRALRLELGSEVSIYENGKNIEITCNTVGSKNKVIKAVKFIHDELSNEFKKATKGIVINSYIYNNIKPSYKLLTSTVSEEHFRKFAFEMMSKNG